MESLSGVDLIFEFLFLIGLMYENHPYPTFGEYRIIVLYCHIYVFFKIQSLKFQITANNESLKKSNYAMYQELELKFDHSFIHSRIQR